MGSIPSRPHGGLPSTREPDGCANAESSKDPSAFRSDPSPASGPMVPFPMSSRQIWCGPAMAMSTSSPRTWRSQGEPREASRAGNVPLRSWPCFPVPDTCGPLPTSPRGSSGFRCRRRGGSRHGTRSPAASGTALPSRVHPRSRGPRPEAAHVLAVECRDDDAVVVRVRDVDVLPSGSTAILPRKDSSGCLSSLRISRRSGSGFDWSGVPDRAWCAGVSGRARRAPPPLARGGWRGGSRPPR